MVGIYADDFISASGRIRLPARQTLSREGEVLVGIYADDFISASGRIRLPARQTLSREG